MKKFAITILILTAAVSLCGQTKTVTNADLEKYRQTRLESERQLKEKYAELGFPSPEQLEKQKAERRREMEQYSDELRQRRIQREIIAQTSEQIAQRVAELNYLSDQGVFGGQAFVYSYGFPFYGYPPFGFHGKGRSVLSRIRRLPPNARTVQEYALMYPNWRPSFNRPTG